MFLVERILSDSIGERSFPSYFELCIYILKNISNASYKCHWGSYCMIMYHISVISVISCFG